MRNALKSCRGSRSFSTTSLAAEMADDRIARAFVDGLRDLGWVEGRNIMIERRSAEGRYERFPSLMQELLAIAGRRDRGERTRRGGSEARDRHDSDRVRGRR